MRKRLTHILLFAALAAANAQEKIIILDEGGWQQDNGRLSYFADGTVVSNDWFSTQNGYKLGDTPNDIVQINSNLLAIAVNWSNIIQFITPEGKAVAAIENVPNNRRLATDGQYLYVTSYGHECTTTSGTMTFTRGFVAKIDVTTFQVVAACEVGYEPEGIALYNGYLFVANTGGYSASEAHDYESTVSMLDAKTMTLVRNIDTQQPNLYSKMSQSGQYLCFCSPGDYYTIAGATVIFDCAKAIAGADDCFATIPYVATYSTVARDGNFFAVGSSYSYVTWESTFNCLTIDPKSVMETSGASGVSSSLPGTLASDLENMTAPYDLYVNPYTGYIYATDAGNYAAAGYLYQWSPEGKQQGKYKLYINPGHILALPPDGNFSGISAIRVDAPSVADDAVYNLQGFRVTSLVKGQIYICNGRKFIAN